ncbi:MAG: hypothetical protein ACOVME_12630, partial [Rhodobacter sp.]
MIAVNPLFHGTGYQRFVDVALGDSQAVLSLNLLPSIKGGAMSGIEITRRDLTAGELRGAAGKSRDAKAA